jgi:hypothetical protein
MTAREIAMHRRELERLARTAERHTEKAHRDSVYSAAPEIAARHRFMKVVLSLSVFASIAGACVALLLAARSYLVLDVRFGLLGIIGLVAVNTATVTVSTPVARPRREVAQPAVDETWTPIRTPPVHNSIPEGAGLIVTDETEKAIAARERAARIREQAARASQPGVAPDPRFTEPVVPVADETGAIDINAALRARRAN